MQRPYCGYFRAAILSLWVLVGYGAIVTANVQAGWDWLDWVGLPIEIGVYIYIIRLIWRR